MPVVGEPGAQQVMGGERQLAARHGQRPHQQGGQLRSSGAPRPGPRAPRHAPRSVPRRSARRCSRRHPAAGRAAAGRGGEVADVGRAGPRHSARASAARPAAASRFEPERPRPAARPSVGSLRRLLHGEGAAQRSPGRETRVCSALARSAGDHPPDSLGERRGTHGSPASETGDQVTQPRASYGYRLAGCRYGPRPETETCTQPLSPNFRVAARPPLASGIPAPELGG
jgi:hypothetical protein